jgi:2-methylcitrate dehydratase PrpD
VRTRDGRLFEKKIDFAKGGPSHPVTRKEVEDKFRRLSAKILPEDKVQELYGTVQHLEDVASVDELTRCLVP